MQLRTPDMIVLDIKLPDGNGLEICRELKSSIKTHAIPVMMMSADNYLSKVKSRCVADEFINKPFDINDFANRIEYYVAS
ncbi:KDP operon transcriptional regulatory protein KdpE [compost metagenome]